jgi:GNT-I family
MNLAVTTALVLSFLLAFSIGLNLGLHGVLSFGDSRVLTRAASNSDSQQKQPDTIAAIPDSHPTDSNRPVDADSESHENELPSKVSQTGQVSQSSLKVLNEIYEGKSVLDAITASALSLTKGDITTFLQNGGALPIVLLTCNRPEQLQKTLDSLLSVRGVTKENLIVAQDGAMESVAEVVKTNGLTLLQNIEGINLRGGAGGDGAERIAKHYKFSLSAAFDQMPLAPAIIIAEDDLLFSPDFYEYLAATAPILETDPTTFVVSAWNDNGFNGRVSDVHALRRTEFFPGLGWLLPRKLYKNELEQQWPTQHWDHWLRSVEVHGTRDIVYPEVLHFYFCLHFYWLLASKLHHICHKHSWTQIFTYVIPFIFCFRYPERTITEL